VGLAGASVQGQVSFGLFELSIPMGFVIIAILIATIKYNSTGSSLGPTLDQKLAIEMNGISRNSAFEDIVRIYEEAGEKNKKRLMRIDKWIFVILLLMSLSLVSLLIIIVFSA